MRVMKEKKNNKWRKSSVLKNRTKGIWYDFFKDTPKERSIELINIDWEELTNYDTINLDIPTSTIAEEWEISNKKVRNLEVEIVRTFDPDSTWEQLINYIKAIDIK